MDFKSLVTQNGLRLDSYSGLVDINGNPLASRPNLMMQTRFGSIADDSGNDQTLMRIAHPRYNPFVKDEFLRGDVANTGNIGDLGWYAAFDAAPTYNQTTAHPGMLLVNSGPAAGNVFMMCLRPIAGGAVTGFLSSEPFDTYWIVRPSSADSDTQLYFGLISSTTLATVKAGTPVTSAFGFKKDFADTGMFGYVDVSGARTVSTNPIVTTLATTTYYRWRIRRLTASTIGFSVNDGADEVVTATPPGTTPISAFLMLTTQAAANKTCFVDYFDLSFGINATAFAR